MGIYEVLLMDPTLRGLVVAEASLEQVREQLKLASQRGRIGQLSADQPSAEVLVSCTEVWQGQNVGQ